MRSMKRTAVALALTALLAAPASAAIAKPSAAPKAPHACSSHSVKVVTSKCADRNRDGMIEYLLDGTTR